jgi:hypothetical protein
MNTTQYVGKFLATLVGVSTSIITIGLTHDSFAQDKAPNTQERIGVYDSRAIAVAYYGSPMHQERLRQLMAEHQKAKGAGDLAKVAQLEAEGKTQQEKAHQQGFSTAPVDELLLQITNALPEIQKAAGVTALISKWDKAGLKKHPGAERVDVTLALVDAFHPSERQRNSAIKIQKTKPLNLEQANED